MSHKFHKTDLPNRTKTMRFYPFVFTGKERDEETGYGYTSALGGRYENHYYYDPLHRLTRAGGADQYGFEQAFELSRAGRPLSMSTNGKVKHYAYGEHTPPHAPQRIMVEEGFRHTLHDLRWDPAGNLGQVSTLSHDRGDIQSRFLFWTEDSRLHTVVDDRHHSYYAYDHTGERTMKVTGHSHQLDVNADLMHTAAGLDEFTLYPSPYLVFTNRGYTKHYYAGTERLAARVGGGFGRNIAYPDPKISDAATVLFKQCKAQIPNRQLPDPPRQCIRPLVEPMHPELLHENLEHIPRRLVADAYVSENLLLDEFQGFSGNEEEPDVYFYHSDHLGSASWITDATGTPVQHLQYLPYGEPFVNQRAAGSTYSERFRFTGKERDEETGYSYFGARYMDHELMTMWLSVDPLADKYPNISPYNYCMWNPVKLVDPDGKEISPIYDKWGNLLGTDDQGLKGKAIVMDEKNFSQGMSHEDALRYNLGKDGFQDDIAYAVFSRHYAGLKDRPDYDGILTLFEANDWYRNGNGKPLYVNAAKISLFPITVNSFDEGEGTSITPNFLGRKMNPTTGLVYGQIKLTLLNKSTGEVRLGNSEGRLDNYGFEQHPNGTAWRNFSTKVGAVVAGKGNPFDIYTYNTGTVWH